MTADNEPLFLVKRSSFNDQMEPDKYWLFRARTLASNFVKKRKDHDEYEYVIVRPKWGPE